MKAPPYSTVHVVKMTGLSYRKLDYWVRIGYVESSVRDAHGSGSQRLYSAQDVERIQAILALTRCGFELGGAVRLVDGAIAMDEVRSVLDHVEQVAEKLSFQQAV